MQLAVGGPLTGLAFGICTTVWLRYMYNNPTAEITLTIVSAYGTYLVADELFHVSAVLAVVVLGEALVKPMLVIIELYQIRPSVKLSSLICNRWLTPASTSAGCMRLV